MDFALIVSAFLLGLAGTPHCAAMCGAPCAAVIGGSAQFAARSLSFHLARAASYAAAGGLAAAGVGMLSWSGSAALLFRPLWVMLHAAALALGLYLLLTGRQPAFMTRLGRRQSSAALAVGGGGWQRVQTPWSAAAAGSAWAAWPCGLLQSALVVAALANTPLAGGAVMASFAMASAAGLLAAPWLLRPWSRRGDAVVAWAIRLSGAALAAASAWALSHDLWGRLWAYCFS